MNPTLTLCIAAAVLTAAPCLAGNVKNDFDPDVDFSRYHTFSFIGGKDIGRSGWLDDPDMRERFKNFISGALEMRGLKEVPKDENFSLAVRYWVARRQKQDVTVIDYGPSMMWGGYPPYWTGAWGYSYEEYVVTNYIQGTLGGRSDRPGDEGTGLANLSAAEDRGPRQSVRRGQAEPV